LFDMGFQLVHKILCSVGGEILGGMITKDNGHEGFTDQKCFMGWSGLLVHARENGTSPPAHVTTKIGGLAYFKLVPLIPWTTE